MSIPMTPDAIAIRVADAFGVNYETVRRYNSDQRGETWGAIQESILTNPYEVQVWVTRNDDVVTVEFIIIGAKSWQMNEFSFTLLADEATSVRVERFIAYWLKVRSGA